MRHTYTREYTPKSNVPLFTVDGNVGTKPSSGPYTASAALLSCKIFRRSLIWEEREEEYLREWQPEKTRK